MANPQAPATAPTQTPVKMTVEPIVRPLGLITQPNKLGYYDNGALSTASGVYIRDPGVITTQAAFVQQFAGAWGGGSSTFELVPVDGVTQFKYMTLYLLTADSKWRYAFDNGAGSTIVHPMFFSTAAEALQSASGYGRIRGYTINGGRLVVPGLTSTSVFDLVSSGTPAVRPAGLPPPHITDLSPTITTATGAPLPTGTHVHYVAVQRRKFDDGVELVSAPSPANYIANSSGSPQIVSITVATRHANLTTDYIDIYKTKRQALTVNTGSDYYLCASVKVGTTAFTTLGVTDGCNDENLGQALYTNSGVRGAAAANMCPPLANSVATFKGYTFYLGCTELPSITLRVGGGFFRTVDSSAGLLQFRTYGIGRRFVTGTCSNGGNVISAVSASDMIGIVIGQDLSTSPVGFSAAMTVSAVGASTITFTGGTFTGASVGGSFAVSDKIEIDGFTPTPLDIYEFDSLQRLLGFYGNYIDTVAIDVLDRVLPPAALTAFSSLNGTIPADSFTIYRPYSVNTSVCTSAMTIRATNGKNYTPPLARIETADTATSVPIVVRKNMIRWSEQNNADACPLANNAFCGVGDLYRAYPMRDCMLIFASDGCWRLSGTGGQAGSGYDWRIDPIDSTLILAGPRCGCVARDAFYGYTNRGFVSVDSSGTVREISQRRVQDLMPGPPWSDTQAACVFFDETNDEVIIKTELSTVFYVYNILTDAFTTLINAGGTMFDGAFIRADQRIATINASGVYAQSGAFSGVASQVDYQPTYGTNPFAMQQWQSMELVFDAANTGLSVTPRFNAVAGTARALNARGTDQARANFGVGRNTPAKATCLAPGWSVAGGLAQLRFFGAALRKVAIGIQREQR
jgi:hypothetical protein